jgi:2,4-dienoyl-CoA reductase-like NADH-dependent reductase (Old Yellow Enzyme family)
MHERFRFSNSDELREKAFLLGFDLPWSDDLSILFDEVSVPGIYLPNRFAVQPMEGYDSLPDGSPSELTFRRYARYAGGGSGLIWHEAVAVCREGRSSPSQLWINENNTDSYRRLTSSVKEEAAKIGKKVFQVIQLTHSGRYSKPDGKPAPLVPALNSILDKGNPAVLSDSELEQIGEQFVKAAGFAVQAGYDAIDIKTCHGYLLHEMLSCRQRKNSVYGGEDPAYRFRLILSIFDELKSAYPSIELTTRLCVWDGWEGGFGMRQGSAEPDFTEPLLFLNELVARGVKMINISMGSPYHNPHIVRPYDNPVPGTAQPPEHPLSGVGRMLDGTSHIAGILKNTVIVGSAYSWLREYAPNVAAGNILSGGSTVAGFGRGAFAYPDMPNDILTNGRADKEKVCITCSGCTRLVRSLHHGGCVIRDRKIYGEELKKLIADERAGI